MLTHPARPSPPLLPAPLLGALQAVRTIGRPLLVGGCVRDWLAGRIPKDFDVEVYGVTPEQLAATLARFGDTDPVGKSFGVIKLRLGGVDYDFALPRRETKTAAGHRGFAVGVDPSLTPAEALARRDFTVNAMALDPFSGELIDPHGGRADLAAGLLRHASAAHPGGRHRHPRQGQPQPPRSESDPHTHTSSLLVPMLRRAPPDRPARSQCLTRLRSTAPVLPSTSSFTRSPWALRALTS